MAIVVRQLRKGVSVSRAYLSGGVFIQRVEALDDYTSVGTG
jgi:hypothetical protein